MQISRATRLSDSIRGCIIAGAIGDALGGPFEGQPGPLEFREHSNWAISDDSQLTLATCESIIEIGRVSPEHIAGRFVQWLRDRRITGMGASTLKALRDLDAGAHWALAGAWIGASQISRKLIELLPDWSNIERIADRFADTVRPMMSMEGTNEDTYGT